MLEYALFGRTHVKENNMARHVQASSYVEGQDVCFRLLGSVPQRFRPLACVCNTVFSSLRTIVPMRRSPFCLLLGSHDCQVVDLLYLRRRLCVIRFLEQRFSQTSPKVRQQRVRRRA